MPIALLEADPGILVLLHRCSIRATHASRRCSHSLPAFGGLAAVVLVGEVRRMLLIMLLVS